MALGKGVELLSRSKSTPKATWEFFNDTNTFIHINKTVVTLNSGSEQK